MRKIWQKMTGEDKGEAVKNAADLEQASASAAQTEPTAMTREENDDVLLETAQARDLGDGQTGPGDDLVETAPLQTQPETTHPLNPDLFTSITSRNAVRSPRIEAVSRSIIGAVRQRNEDVCFSFVSQSEGDDPLPPFGLFIVADGMGGHFDGHIASKIASRRLTRHVLEQIYSPLLREDVDIPSNPIQEILEEAVHLANKALYIPDPEQSMGTTLTAALIFGRRLCIVHVGDSRAYLLQNNELTAVTTDHSFVRAMQEAGQLTAEEAATHPERNLLYRALNGDKLEQIDSLTKALSAKGMLLLCSDGLWGLISDETLEEILTGSETLRAKADRLVEEALAAGGHDNITAVLVDFSYDQ